MWSEVWRSYRSSGWTSAIWPQTLLERVFNLEWIHFRNSDPGHNHAASSRLALYVSPIYTEQRTDTMGGWLDPRPDFDKPYPRLRLAPCGLPSKVYTMSGWAKRVFANPVAYKTVPENEAIIFEAEWVPILEFDLRVSWSRIDDIADRLQPRFTTGKWTWKMRITLCSMRIATMNSIS